MNFLIRHNHVKKAARQYRKELKNKIDLYNVTEYLKTKGHTVVFFNTPSGDEKIIAFDLKTEAETLKAFTCCEQNEISFVCVDNNLHNTDKLYLLLHETAHILLKHIGDSRSEYLNQYLAEIEAEAFVYDVLIHSNAYCMH